MESQAYKWINGQTYRWTERQADIMIKHTDEQKYRQMDKYTDGQTDKEMEKWTNI